MDSKKDRSSNFSNEEITILTREVTAWEHILFGDFGPNLTFGQKTRAWECVAAKVNAQSHTRRTIAQIKSKWKDIKCRTKKKASENYRHMQGTGGGPQKCTPLTPTEELVIKKTVGWESIHGVGGVDTSKHLIQQHSSTDPSSTFSKFQHTPFRPTCPRSSPSPSLSGSLPATSSINQRQPHSAIQPSCALSKPPHTLSSTCPRSAPLSSLELPDSLPATYQPQPNSTIQPPCTLSKPPHTLRQSLTSFTFSPPSTITRPAHSSPSAATRPSLSLLSTNSHPPLSQTAHSRPPNFPPSTLSRSQSPPFTQPLSQFTPLHVTSVTPHPNVNPSAPTHTSSHPTPKNSVKTKIVEASQKNVDCLEKILQTLTSMHKLQQEKWETKKRWREEDVDYKNKKLKLMEQNLKKSQ